MKKSSTKLKVQEQEKQETNHANSKGNCYFNIQFFNAYLLIFTTHMRLPVYHNFNAQGESNL